MSGFIPLPPEALEAATFYPLEGQAFRFEGPGVEPWESVLLGVSPFEGGPVQGFALAFALGEGPVRPQGTYRVSGPGIGPWDFFISPVQSGQRGGVCYEAVFSRLVEAGPGRK